MFLEFLMWWYGPGWLNAWRTARNWVRRVQLEFSVSELVRNLFAPWKQIVSVSGRSIDEKFKALIDNLFSRVIGFFVRFFVLVTAAILIVLTAVAGALMAVAWPFVPLATVYLAYRSVKG